jgi:hypothetical protein
VNQSTWNLVPAVTLMLHCASDLLSTILWRYIISPTCSFDSNSDCYILIYHLLSKNARTLLVISPAFPQQQCIPKTPIKPRSPIRSPAPKADYSSPARNSNETFEFKCFPYSASSFNASILSTKCLFPPCPLNFPNNDFRSRYGMRFQVYSRSTL